MPLTIGITECELMLDQILFRCYTCHSIKLKAFKSFLSVTYNFFRKFRRVYYYNKMGCKLIEI